MDQIRELTVLSMFIRITASMVLGGILGLERGLQNRPAGLRTYILVSMGACIVMLTNQYVYLAYNTGDPVRMSAQVISGIGFLGAGTIIVTKRNQIKGLTTAAGLWASACVGLSIGIGLYEVGILGGIAIFLVLRVLNRWDHYIKENKKSVDLYIELESSSTIGGFIRNLRKYSLDMKNLQFENEGVNSFTISISGPSFFTHSDIMKLLKDVDGVEYFEEI